MAEINHDLMEISTLYETQQYEAAYHLLLARLDQFEDDGRAWEMLGLIEYAQENAEASVSALERASLLVPLRNATRVCLGYAYAEIGRTQLAADLLAELIPDESISVSLLLKIAAGLDSTGEPGLAMRACRVASQRDPHFAQTYYDMGFYATRTGYPPSVTESLAAKAISLEPSNACYRVGLASMLIFQNRNHEAYKLVKDFGLRQVQQIHCPTCLQRIVDLLENQNNKPLASLCREQVRQLKNHDSLEDCL